MATSLIRRFGLGLLVWMTLLAGHSNPSPVNAQSVREPVDGATRTFLSTAEERSNGELPDGALPPVECGGSCCEDVRVWLDATGVDGTGAGLSWRAAAPTAVHDVILDDDGFHPAELGPATGAAIRLTNGGATLRSASTAFWSSGPLAPGEHALLGPLGEGAWALVDDEQPALGAAIRATGRLADPIIPLRLSLRYCAADGTCIDLLAVLDAQGNVHPDGVWPAPADCAGRDPTIGDVIIGAPPEVVVLEHAMASGWSPCHGAETAFPNVRCFTDSDVVLSLARSVRLEDGRTLCFQELGAWIDQSADEAPFSQRAADAPCTSPDAYGLHERAVQRDHGVTITAAMLRERACHATAAGRRGYQGMNGPGLLPCIAGRFFPLSAPVSASHGTDR